MTEIPEPDRIGVAGDWHGNTRQAVSAIRRICAKLTPPRIILHAGDFGFKWENTEYTWAGVTYHKERYLEEVSRALEKEDATLYAVHGNHEDHDWLDQSKTGGRHGLAHPVQILPRIWWLTLGTRWIWHDRTWLAAGGAVSVDKLLRVKWYGDWYPQETITDEQEAAIISGGPADVMLCHDAPACLPLPLMDPPPAAWVPMIPEAEAHRERIQRICAATAPSWFFHGHYHLQSDQDLDVPWGQCRFISLDMDGTQGNWGILGTRTMEWEW